MRGEPVFLGVYVKTSDSDSADGATRWHAWGLPDGDFLLQEAPQDQAGKVAGLNPGAGVQRLSVEDFFTDYRVFAAFSSKNKPQFPEETAGSSPVPAAASPGTSTASQNTARSAQAGATPQVQPSQAAAGSPAQAARPAQSVQPGQSVPPPQSGSTEQPAQGAQNAKSAARPGSDHTDLVTYLTQGLGDTGKDYVVVKGTPEEDGIHSNLQAQELIFIEEADGSLAVPMDEEEIAKIEQGFRTEFSLALIRLKSKRGDALQSLEKLARSEGPFAREHKFMFSDCGTALRKRNLYVLAQQFHERARELAPDDEHVLFNLARVLYECGKTDRARECLAQSVEMAPDFQAGRDFLDFLDGPSRF